MKSKFKTFDDLVDQNKKELALDEKLLSQIELRLEKRFSQQTEEK